MTNRQFAAFVKATGYVTVAEKAPDPRDYPGAQPDMLRAGSLVFTPPKGPLNGNDISQWRSFKFGANWHHPYGGRSDIRGGGLEGVEFAWGDELTPDGKLMANTWQGTFPTHSTKPPGLDRTKPIRSFPANGYGVYDMIGNVWEWTSDFWSTRHPEPAAKSCCIPKNPRGGALEASYDPRQPAILIAQRVLKGGSHLCAPNFCRRYRPAARHAEPEDTSTSHVGFRCLKRG